ncbi:MAG TPA: hypothetical protein VGR35_12750 [Tepidisphaeraceae bacterium]|nr:hypothetical protein [Tepidisphaeraceae bacterium]
MLYRDSIRTIGVLDGDDARSDLAAEKGFQRPGATADVQVQRMPTPVPHATYAREGEGRLRHHYAPQFAVQLALAQLPKDQDRQDAGAAQNRPQKQAFPEPDRGHATTNATTAETSAAESDERLLKLIEAWPRLTAVRQRMIQSIIEAA